MRGRGGPTRASLRCWLQALSWEAGLWALDQGVTQGWGVLAELSAACLWLLRREVRSK